MLNAFSYKFHGSWCALYNLPIGHYAIFTNIDKYAFQTDRGIRYCQPEFDSATNEQIEPSVNDWRTQS